MLQVRGSLCKLGIPSRAERRDNMVYIPVGLILLILLLWIVL